jgi:hypothetical protein
MDQIYLQWIGYFASAVIAVSMMMQSIVKFRWINLIGATTFAIYGLLIGAIPVFLLNAFIVTIDLFFLNRIYRKKHLFETLQVQPDSPYMLRFLEFHKKDINKFFPEFEYKPEMNTTSFFVLRNMAVSGLFLAHSPEPGTLKVGLDYVIPEYRDYKNGTFVYHRLRDQFKQAGYNRIIARSCSARHKSYLSKIGFVQIDEGLFERKL